MEDNGYFIKRLFRKQSLLNVCTQVVSTLGPLVCTVLAGTHFGSEGLAIIAICAPLFLAALFVGTIISGGAQVVCSAYIARDETDSVNRVYSTAIALTLCATVLLYAAMLLFKNPLLTLMVGDISPELSAYYNFFAAYAAATMLIYVPLYFSRVAGRIGIGLTLTGVMATVSIGASLVLIRFMSIEAIALSQLIGSISGLAVSMSMLRKHFKLTLPVKRFITPILASGSPGGMTRLYVLLITMALNTLFLRVGGSTQLAVYGVIATLHRFNAAAIHGVSQTLVPLIGVFHTENDVTSIKQTMKLSFLYGNGLMLAIGAIFIIFSSQLAALFGLVEGSGLEAAVPFYAAHIVLLFNTAILTAYYNAAKRLRLANTIAFLQEFALIGAGAFVFANIFGASGIWAAFPIAGAGTLGILFVLLGVMKIKQRGLSVPLLLSNKLETEGRYVSFSVESELSKASEAAAKISEFCKKSDMPPKQTMLISLSVEEIIALIINNSKQRDYSVSVRLLLQNDGIILRIRNAGDKFDAIEYYKANISDDIEKSLEVIGMKYIVESAKKIYYRETFGVSNLVVIL